MLDSILNDYINLHQSFGCKPIATFMPSKNRSQANGSLGGEQAEAAGVTSSWPRRVR
jgi:hypothetical protein